MATREDLERLVRERILILDGAMGTMIQSYSLTEEDFRGKRFADLPGMQKGNNDLLSITRPDVIGGIHRRYLQAGADIIETNTFSSQRISMEDYHAEDFCREINLAAVRLARSIADEFTRSTPDKPRFVAGSIGPTNKTCSLSPDVNNPALRNLTFDELAVAYEEQMSALLEGGVDLFLIETIFDTLNAKAALFAAEKAMNAASHHVPIMLSVTVSDKAGRTLSGQTLEAFLASVSHADIFSVGLNCSFGARDMKPFLASLAGVAPYYISAYPNAGLPNAMGQYDQTPDDMAGQVGEFISEGLVNIIGGCCGTTDAYIARYGALIKDEKGWKRPHIPVKRSKCLSLSGLEVKKVFPDSNFMNIGERCNVAGSRKFLRLVKEKKYDEALLIARKQVDDGAQVLDINMDDGLLDAKEEMINFINLLASEPEIARIPLMIDSSKWEVILAGLKCAQGKCIVNSISLKEGEEKFLSHARELRSLGAAVVVMAFDEVGQAVTYERKIEICGRAYKLLTEVVDFPPEDIIFDPNVLSIATGMPEHDSYALDFVRAAEWIRKNLPYAHVSGGVSNLSFSFRGNEYVRQAMNAVFLYHAVQAGMDMGIVNPSASVLYSDIPEEQLKVFDDAIMYRSPEAAEHLIELADRLKEEGCGAKTGAAGATRNEWRNGTVEERLAYAMVKGTGEFLEEDMAEAIGKYPRAVNIIEGPLMEAMNEVGKLFASGKMFLPQVVKTARTMKAAVAILQPLIEKDKAAGAGSVGKVLIATVKGDVHDIGKNIVAVVLACNNFQVIDLGVMCPPENIVKRAMEEKADVVALSGLITPSLDEMVQVARMMREAGLSVPIMVGGATTSKLHTALKISPAYGHTVVWTKDASQAAIVAARLMNKETSESYKLDIEKEYEHLRSESQGREKPVLPLDEARKRKLELF